MPAEIKPAPDDQRAVAPKEGGESDSAAVLDLDLVGIHGVHEGEKERDVNAGRGNAKQDRPDQLPARRPGEPVLPPNQRAEQVGEANAEASAHEIKPGADGGAFGV